MQSEALIRLKIIRFIINYKLGERPVSQNVNLDDYPDVAPSRYGAAYTDSIIQVVAKTGIELDVGYKDSFVPDLEKIDLTIQSDEDQNVAVFWYAQGNFEYTVNHYREGEVTPFETNTGKTTNSMVTVTPKTDVKVPGTDVPLVSQDTQVTINIKQDPNLNVVNFIYSRVEAGAAVCIIRNYIYNDSSHDKTRVTLNSSKQINDKLEAYIDPVPETISGYEYIDRNPEYIGRIQLLREVTYIDYYYDLKSYPYTATAVDKDKREIDVLPTIKGSAKYKTQISNDVFSGYSITKVFTAQDPTDYFTIDYLDSSNSHEFVYVEKNAEFAYSVNNSDYGSIDKEGQILGSYTGSASEVTATAKPGHTFVKWVDKDGKTVCDTAKFAPSKIYDVDIDYYVSAKYQAVFASARNMLQIAAAGETINSNEFFDVTDVNGTRTITLKKDIDCQEQDLSQIVIPTDKTIVIDLKNHKINRNADSVLDNGRVISNTGNLTIKDTSDGSAGSITGGNCSADGGGILNNGTLTLNNCSVKSNTSSANGDNIANIGILNVSGKTVVSDTANNVYLANNSLINVDSSLNEGSLIGVTVANGPTGGTPVQVSGCNVSNSQYFKSDNGDYVITTLNKETGLYLDAYIASGGSITGYTGTIIASNIQISLYY